LKLAYLKLKNLCALRSFSIERDFHLDNFVNYHIVSLLPLAELWDYPVTWELKNIPPLAAVENIGQWTKVWTSMMRGVKNLNKVVKAMIAVKLFLGD